MRDLVLEYKNGLIILNAHRTHNTISELDEHKLSDLMVQIWIQLTFEERIRVAEYSELLG
jgi:hypothetical protein